MFNMRSKFLLIAGIVFLVAGGIFISTHFAAQDPVNGTPHVWPPYTDPKPRVVTRVQRPEIVASFGQVDTELRRLLARFGAPPLPDTYPADIAINVKPQEGLTIVETILHSSVADDFIGRFDRSSIFPGAIVDCMPYVRADLDMPTRSLSSLERNPYKVSLATYVPSLPDRANHRADWEVANGRQDTQSAYVLGTVYGEVSAQADNFTSPTRVRRTGRFAHSFSEAQAKLGISLNNPFVNIKVGRDSETKANRGVFLGMVQQEFFRLNASPLKEDASGPEAWLPDSPENRNALEGLSPSNTMMPGIPALIREVRYGRVIIVAFEVDWSQELRERFIHADGNDGSTSGSIDLFNSAFESASSGTIDVIIYGGGELPDLPSTIETIKGENSQLGDGVQLRVNKSNAVNVIDTILRSGSTWSSKQPGAPIGITFELLDDAGTQLKPLNTSLIELARAAKPSEGWNIQLDVQVNNDYEADSVLIGTLSGDWDFTFKAGDTTLVEFNRSVTAPESFSHTPTVEMPVVWSTRIGQFSIKIIEKDGFFRGSDDGSEFEFPGELVLRKPDSYDDYEAKLIEIERKIESLSGMFRQTLQLDNASDAPESFQASAFGEWLNRRTELSLFVPQVRGGLDQLKELQRAAISDLVRMQDSGADTLAVTDAGNTYNIKGKPDMRAYIAYIRSTIVSFEDVLHSVEDYLDR